MITHSAALLRMAAGRSNAAMQSRQHLPVLIARGLLFTGCSSIFVWKNAFSCRLARQTQVVTTPLTISSALSEVTDMKCSSSIPRFSTLDSAEGHGANAARGFSPCGLPAATSMYAGRQRKFTSMGAWHSMAQPCQADDPSSEIRLRGG